MANLREAFQYAAQNPNSDFAKNLSSLASSGSLNVEAKKYGLDMTPFQQQQPEQPQPQGDTGLGGIATGVGKGILSTVKGIGQVGESIGQGILGGVEKLTGLPVTPKSTYSEQALQQDASQGGAMGKLLNKDNLAPKSTAESIGKGAEQIAEFFVPAGVVGKAEKAINAFKGTELLPKLIDLGLNEKTAQTLVNAGKVGAKSLLRGVESGGVATIQNGGVDTGAKVAGGIGAISPILSAGVKLLKPAVAPTLEFTSGVPKQAIQKAMTGDEAVKLGMNMSTEEVRNKALEAYKGLDSTLKSDFSKTLDELSKLSPRIKPARTAPVGGTSVFSGVKGEFKSLVENAKDSIPNIFRDTRISVKGNQLDFNKLNSSIISPTEQKQLQAVYDTIRNQKDFSVKGVQDVASRINALSKIDTLKGTVTSVPITKIHNIYDKAIAKVYPDLGKLRSNYATTKTMLGEISNVIGTNAKNPTQVQSSISKLTNLYKTDKQTYLNVIEDLSKKSGVDISGMLAGTEFNKVLPDFVRGIGGGGALAAGASFVNPLTLLLFPLFSPKTIGKIITNAPKIGKGLNATRKVITGGVSQGLKQ